MIGFTFLGVQYVAEPSSGLLSLLFFLVRLVRMHEDKSEFAALIISRRQEEFEALKRARERRLAERRAQKKNERELARRHEFVCRCRQRVEDKVHTISPLESYA